METITRAIHTAEERIWGSPPREGEPSDKEPISGIKGEGTATDPYDAGNATEQPGNPAEGHSEESAARQTAPMNGNIATQPVPFEGGASGGTTADPAPPHISTDPIKPGAPDSVFSDDTPSGGRERSHNVTTGEPEDLPTESPETHSTDVIDPAGVPGHSQVLAHDEVEDLQTDMTAPKGMSPPTSETERTERTGSGSSQGSAQSELPIPHEKTYRSSGFAAEGGDFDAAASGAGREADRLREVHDMPRVISREEEKREHHGGLWTGSHKSGITIEKAKEKLRIGRKKKNNSNSERV